MVAANSGRRTAARPAAMRRGGHPSRWTMFSASAEVGKGREGRREGREHSCAEGDAFFSVSFCFHFSFTCRRQNPTAPGATFFFSGFPFLHSGPGSCTRAGFTAGFLLLFPAPGFCWIRCKWVWLMILQ